VTVIKPFKRKKEALYVEGRWKRRFNIYFITMLVIFGVSFIGNSYYFIFYDASHWRYKSFGILLILNQIFFICILIFLPFFRLMMNPMRIFKEGYSRKGAGIFPKFLSVPIYTWNYIKIIKIEDYSEMDENNELIILMRVIFYHTDNTVDFVDVYDEAFKIINVLKQVVPKKLDKSVIKAMKRLEIKNK